MRSRKNNKSKSLIAAELSMEMLLKRVGYKGNKSGKPVNEIPDYSSDYYSHTSNIIPATGRRKQTSSYTGSEIAGVALNHKQNYEPVRKDNKQAAVDAAQMRRN